MDPVWILWPHAASSLAVMRREWTEDGQLWIQYVSSTPATRLDVINLQVLSAQVGFAAC